MTRLIRLLLTPLVLSVLGFVPAADAAGLVACSITGTISFSPSPQTPTRGNWRIEPAVIDCHGLFNGAERILRPAPFTGEGEYTTAPGGHGACVHHIGSGTVDYLIPTSEQDVHIVEPHSSVMAGAGSFTTPSLQGSFQVSPPYDSLGDCLTQPVTRALFIAQGAMVRFRRPPVTGTDAAASTG